MLNTNIKKEKEGREEEMKERKEGGRDKGMKGERKEGRKLLYYDEAKSKTINKKIEGFRALHPQNQGLREGLIYLRYQKWPFLRRLRVQPNRQVFWGPYCK